MWTSILVFLSIRRRLIIYSLIFIAVASVLFLVIKFYNKYHELIIENEKLKTAVKYYESGNVDLKKRLEECQYKIDVMLDTFQRYKMRELQNTLKEFRNKNYFNTKNGTIYIK